MTEWTDEDDAIIRRLYIGENRAASLVAGVIGKGATPGAVRSRAHRLQVTRPKGPGPKPPLPKSGVANDPTWRPARPGKPGPRAVVLADLGARCCKWPVGRDPGEGRMYLQLFCGEPADGNYCANHGELAFPKGAKR